MTGECITDKCITGIYIACDAMTSKYTTSEMP